MLNLLYCIKPLECLSTNVSALDLTTPQIRSLKAYILGITVLYWRVATVECHFDGRKCSFSGDALLVDRYGITVSQMISDILFMSSLQSTSFFTNVIYRVKLFFGFFGNNISNTTDTTCRAGSAYPSRGHEITCSVYLGSCCLVFSFLCCVLSTIICLFVISFFSHDRLFSIYEFDCPFGIFRLSFILILIHYKKILR